MYNNKTKKNLAEKNIVFIRKMPCSHESLWYHRYERAKIFFTGDKVSIQ